MEEADAGQVRFDGFVLELLLSEIADGLVSEVGSCSGSRNQCTSGSLMCMNAVC